MTQTPDYKITVTNEDISESTPNSASHCAVALAIRNEITNTKYISVDIDEIRFSIEDTRYIFETPEEIKKGIVDFDKKIKIKSFKFNLSNPKTINKKEINELARQMSRKTSTHHTPTNTRIGNKRELGIRVK